MSGMGSNDSVDHDGEAGDRGEGPRQAVEGLVDDGDGRGRILPGPLDLTIDILLFAGMAALAAVQRWSAGDLIWSLWASSLVVGYSLIVAAIAGQWAAAARKEPRAPIAALTGSLFLLGFFTIHFCLFHFVHGIFVSVFFPPDRAGVPAGPNVDPGDFVVRIVPAVLASYWPFIAASALSRIGDYVRAFRGPVDSSMAKPYLNVIRMHVLIFAFAFLSAAGLRGWILYAVLITYFLPAGRIAKAIAAARRSGARKGPE
jgi:hypothetical protein